MTIDREICDTLKVHWADLGLPGTPPEQTSSLMLKGNQKSIFLVSTTRSGKPDLVLKFSDRPDQMFRLKNEHQSLSNLAQNLPHFAPYLLTPACLANLSGGLGFIRKSAPGIPLSFAFTAPLMGARKSRKLLDRVFGWLLAFQKNARTRLPQLNESDCRKDMLEAHIVMRKASENDLPDVTESAKMVRTALLDGRLAAVPEHGDFNPDNIYLHRRKLYAIDWEWAKIPGLPLIDLFEFALQYTRLKAIQGRHRSQAISDKHLLSMFSPQGDIAPILKHWTVRACRTLGISETFILPLATLFSARYISKEALPPVLGHLQSLFHDL